MNAREAAQAELRQMQRLVERINEAWDQGRINDDHDTVIPEEYASRISMLLES